MKRAIKNLQTHDCNIFITGCRFKIWRQWVKKLLSYSKFFTNIVRLCVRPKPVYQTAVKQSFSRVPIKQTAVHAQRIHGNLLWLPKNMLVVQLTGNFIRSHMLLFWATLIKAEFINHISHTNCRVVVIHCKSCCSLLYWCQFINITFCMGSPRADSIF